MNKDIDGNDCPMGDECAVHFRNNEEYLVDEMEAGRMITYVGKYAVVTDDNPELLNPAFALRLLLIPETPIPPRYETCVVEVGEDGALADIRDDVPLEEQGEMIRFTQLHDEWSNFKHAHDMVVASVEADILDLSTSYLSK